MGTHPIFESDFDCLTECKRFADLRPKHSPAVLLEHSSSLLTGSRNRKRQKLLVADLTFLLTSGTSTSSVMPSMPLPFDVAGMSTRRVARPATLCSISTSENLSASLTLSRRSRRSPKSSSASTTVPTTRAIRLLEHANLSTTSPNHTPTRRPREPPTLVLFPQICHSFAGPEKARRTTSTLSSPVTATHQPASLWLTA